MSRYFTVLEGEMDVVGKFLHVRVESVVGLNKRREARRVSLRVIYFLEVRRKESGFSFTFCFWLVHSIGSGVIIVRALNNNKMWSLLFTCQTIRM